jgi:hypothetical protein
MGHVTFGMRQDDENDVIIPTAAVWRTERTEGVKRFI